MTRDYERELFAYRDRELFSHRLLGRLPPDEVCLIGQDTARSAKIKLKKGK